MIDIPDGFSGFFSSDDFDLATMGLAQPEEPETEEPEINPLHDMDSIEFHLWMVEEAEKEAERRKAAAAQEAAKAADASENKKTDAEQAPDSSAAKP